MARGLQSSGSVVVAHGLCCSVACGILPNQGSNPHPLHWQVDSQPLRHQGSSYFILKTIFFNVDPFLKSLLNLLQYCFCFMFWFFGLEACRILAPQPGIEPTLPALEGVVLTTGPLGKPLYVFFFFFNLLLDALVLRCCVWAFSSCGERGLLFIAVCRLLIAVASLVVEHRL